MESTRISLIQPARRGEDDSTAGVGRLASWVRRARQRARGMAAGEGTCVLAAVLCGLVAIGFAADWWFDLSRAWRAALLGVYALSGAVCAWVYIIRPLRRVPAPEGMALFLERQRPELRSRLISALQLGGAGPWGSLEADEFVNRLVADAGTAIGRIDLGDVVPADGLRRRLRLSLPIVGALALAGIAFAPVTGILLRRALLDEIALPRKTQILEATGSRTLGRGDDLMLEVQARGILPPAGRLLLRHTSGRIQNLNLDRDTVRRGHYQRLLANLPESFSYRVRINDAETEEFRVQVLPRPVVTNLVLTQILPAYIGLEPRRIPSGELNLLRGSRLVIEANANQLLRSAVLRLVGLGADQAATIDVADPRRFTAEVSATNPAWTGLSLALVDQAGIDSRDPPVYPVAIVPDRPPQVRILYPQRREELVTPTATVLLSFEARDDFGLGRLAVRHQPAGETNTPPGSIELDLSGETNAIVRRRFEWKLNSLRPAPTEGMMIEYWVEAFDRNDSTGPGSGRSERYALRIVSQAEKRADLLSRASDSISSLGDVAQGQERLNDSLGRLILEKRSP